ADTPAVLDHSCALPQRDGRPRPALAGRAKRGERNVKVLDARDLFDDALAIWRPRVDAEGEMRPRLLSLLHRHRFLPQSSSASRFTAGCFGFLLLIQCRERPER